mmetsp:Transcript_2729/g.9184  ORF Transcript_2729/g.9184 Transcript_2729/m.9184 type:complete len:228 (+) Transcript_2729:3396-4079(+)
MYAVQVAIDVHRGPRQRDHPRVQLALKVLEVRFKQRRQHWRDLGHHRPVLVERVAQLVVVALQLVLLQHHRHGRLGHCDADAGQQLGLTDQLQDLAVEVDVQLLVGWVADEQRGGDAGFGRLDRLGPRHVPERLKLHHGACDPVVRAHNLLGLLGVHEAAVGLELEHRLLDPAHQLPRPRDGTRHRRHVAHGGRRALLLLVHAAHRLEVEPVVVKDDDQLGVDVVLE